MIARASSLRGDESITVVSAVSPTFIGDDLYSPFVDSGQVYCSRCASNIIKGARFGQDGMIRICNLCLDKLAKVDEDDDDSRSVVSSATSPFAAHQLGSESRSFNLSYLSQSPFAASQLFGRSDSFSLFSIAETKRHRSVSEGSGSVSRVATPDLQDDNITRLVQWNYHTDWIK